MAAAIFWMKARAGWREKHEVSISTGPLDRLSDAELYKLLVPARHGIADEADDAGPGAA